MSKIFKRGQLHGKWTLESYLGGGGNGEVWKCFNKDKEAGAVKLIKSVKQKAYARFLDEIKVIEENVDIEGIVPIIDKYLPKEPKDTVPFYVMPVAQSAEKELLGKSFEEKVEAILQLCETLSALHSRGISHRDIKPPNVLKLQSRYCLADFGLVDYPEKKDISVKNEEIGAKWTLAPEMRRESSMADGMKADVYSLAKTLWIILTENRKGFDGQYAVQSILELRRFYPKIYTSPIDKLLSACTDNDPKSRPTIDEFAEALRNWKTLQADFHEMNQEQWFEVQQKLFPTSFPKRVVWENIDDIISVLNVICMYDNLNHLFFPVSGGLDLEGARRSSEKDCIELDFKLIDIVKPKRLLFESFGVEPEWNYFRLELDKLEPSGVYEAEEDDDPYEEQYDHEAVSELEPGKYGDYDLVENRAYYEEMGRDIPEGARHVTRWFRGVFVIFNKRSTYNLDGSTYDGRHNEMSTDEFRDYIQNSIDIIREENAVYSKQDS